MRSAKAPVISAGVMMANIIWNSMKTWWGMVFEYASNGSTADAAQADPLESRR